MYSSYRAVQAQEEDETYLMEDNHQSATIPVHHRQQTNKQKQKQKEKSNRQTNKQQKKKKKNKIIWLKTITNQRPSLSINDNKQISKNKNKKKKSTDNKQTTTKIKKEQTYLIEDNHQSATIPVPHRQQTNKQKQKEKRQSYLIEDNHQSATIPVPHRQQTNKQKQKQKEKNNRQTNEQQKKKKKNKLIWLKTITNQRPSLSITDNKQFKLWRKTLKEGDRRLFYVSQNL